MKRMMLSAALLGLAAAPLLAGGNNVVSGTYVEARTAEVFAGGCVMNSEAGTAGRQAVLAWKIDRGTVDGVGLDGLSIVTAISGDQNLGIHEIGGGRANTKAVVYVDQRANQAQQTALLAMAHQLSNRVVDTVVEVAPAPIAFTEDMHGIRVAAGQVALDVAKHTEHDPACGASQWFHPLSTVQQATIGTAETHMFSGSGLGSKWSDPNKKSAFFGTFSY